MKWKNLQHNGILLPPLYKPQNIKIKICNVETDLSPIQEEMIYQWAKKKDTPYVQDKTFQKNFVKDFAKTFTPIKKIKYKDLDLTDAYMVVEREKEAKLLMTKEEKKALATQRKEIREKIKGEYGSALIDGEVVELGNYMAEPPGIFIGRGKHPLRGRWKPRIYEKDITLNLGSDAEIPSGEWGGIVHENDGVWVAKWTDKLTEKTKYVWLSDTSYLKQEMDMAKYEKAVILSKDIDTILQAIFKDMASDDGRIATVCYLIYRTAMRVGDEKDEEEADTVGATTLRREHIMVLDDSIKLDFLGKDSVRWQETISIKDNERIFLENMRRLTETTQEGREIFEGIKSSDVNKYLSGIVKGVTAKVFRTYLATKVVFEYLAEHDTIQNDSPSTKIYHAKMANLQAAKKCNHKRAIPKTFAQSLQKRRETLKKIKEQTPWQSAEESLKKIKTIKPKTSKQKKRRLERLRRTRKTINDRKKRHSLRVEKLSLQIRLAEQTRDYNLGTSLRNYIDPRVYKAWTDHVDMEWKKMYTATLQKKFLWVDNVSTPWESYTAMVRIKSHHDSAMMVPG